MIIIGCKPIYIPLFILPFSSASSFFSSLSILFLLLLHSSSFIANPKNQNQTLIGVDSFLNSLSLSSISLKFFFMAASTTSQVYIDVIEDVMVKVRDEFVNTGASPGDEVLRELQAVNFTISSFSLFLLNFQLIN